MTSQRYGAASKFLAGRTNLTASRNTANIMAIIKNKPACTPNSGATSTATATAAKLQPNFNEYNAICVDVIDHGLRKKPWGERPEISFVFETNEMDEYGNIKFFTRTFNNYDYSQSALTLEIRNWLNRDISGADKGWDIMECKGEPATLKTSPAISQTGRHYEKIESVNPSGLDQIEPSGTYERREHD